jgi:hypothetical protein
LVRLAIVFAQGFGYRLPLDRSRRNREKGKHCLRTLRQENRLARLAKQPKSAEQPQDEAHGIAFLVGPL